MVRMLMTNVVTYTNKRIAFRKTAIKAYSESNPLTLRSAKKLLARNPLSFKLNLCGDFFKFTP